MSGNEICYAQKKKMRCARICMGKTQRRAEGELHMWKTKKRGGSSTHVDVDVTASHSGKQATAELCVTFADEENTVHKNIWRVSSGAYAADSSVLLANTQK